MTITSIQWCDRTWNPVRGCSIVSAGCENCYAMKQAHRFSGEGQPYAGLTQLSKAGPVWKGAARFVPEMLAAPLSWRKPARVFVNSMSDLFHEDITNEQIAAVFGVMAACPRHTFQVLTKRPERMREWFGDLPMAPAWEITGAADEATGGLIRVPSADFTWPLPNVWLGVSCENQSAADERIPQLLQTPAAVRFVSAEPLLGPIDFDLPRCDVCHEVSDCTADDEATPWCSEHDKECSYGHWLDFMDEGRSANGGINWVIVGGESGPDARGCDMEWIRSIVQQCAEAGTACFVKQLGAHPYEARPADGGVHGTDEALANLGTPHPQRPWFKGWCLTHTPDGKSTWYRHPRLQDKKGGDIEEWAPEFRVRQFPDTQNQQSE